MHSTAVTTKWFDDTIKRDVNNTRKQMTQTLKTEAYHAAKELLQRRHARMAKLYKRESDT